jgi:hypothetical protein
MFQALPNVFLSCISSCISVFHYSKCLDGLGQIQCSPMCILYIEQKDECTRVETLSWITLTWLKSFASCMGTRSGRFRMCRGAFDAPDQGESNGTRRILVAAAVAEIVAEYHCFGLSTSSRSILRRSRQRLRLSERARSH